MEKSKAPVHYTALCFPPTPRHFEYFRGALSQGDRQTTTPSPSAAGRLLNEAFQGNGTALSYGGSKIHHGLCH